MRASTSWRAYQSALFFILKSEAHHNHMVTNRSQQVVKAMTNALELEMSDGLPAQVAGSIVPTLEVNPLMLTANHTARAVGTSSGGGGNLFVGNTGEDFYITSLTLSAVKDATCDCADGSEFFVSATVNGLTVRVLSIVCLTTTAQSNTISVTFSKPLKIDRNTTVATSSPTFTVGKAVHTATITGITVKRV